MKRLLALVLAALPSPVLAQHTGHAAPADPPPASSCTAEHAAMGHCRLPEIPPAPSCSPEHAAMGHCRPAPADPHAGHAATADETVTPPVAPPPPEARAGPAHAADRVFGPAAMARARGRLVREHGGLSASRFLVDRLEVARGDGPGSYRWDVQAWFGGDIDKLWLKSEGEGEWRSGSAGAEVQALWSHAIDPWFDLHLGLRQDIGTGPERTYLVAAVQGLAPYWLEVEGTLFLSTRGDVTARVEVEHDVRITQALILQPRSEFDFAMQNVPELGLGGGVATGELGARLRYEILPASGPAVVAPYVGVEYERAFGRTARYRRIAGEDIGGWRVLAGIRTWF